MFSWIIILSSFMCRTMRQWFLLVYRDLYKLRNSAYSNIFLVFTVCWANSCIAFLVHALLSAVLFPVCHWGARAYIFGRGGAGDSLHCRVCQKKILEQKKLHEASTKPCLYISLMIRMSSTHQHFERGLTVWRDTAAPLCYPSGTAHHPVPPSPPPAWGCSHSLEMQIRKHPRT